MTNVLITHIFFTGRVWSGPGRARPALYLCRLSGSGHGTCSRWLAGRVDLSWGGIFSLAPLGTRTASLLGGCKRIPASRSVLKGTNATVAGILLAALYNPVRTKGIHSVTEVIIGLGAFGFLQFWKMPSWLVVIVCAGAGLMVS